MNDRFEGAKPMFGAGRTMPNGLLRLERIRTNEPVIAKFPLEEICRGLTFSNKVSTDEAATCPCTRREQIALEL
jgi:hypothetical protein